MADITIKVCSVTFESFFKNAVPFKNARCDEIAQKCLEAFASYGLRPPQISLRNGDQLFNYDLSFSLFNGNGTFRISAEKLDVSLQNAVTEKDLEVVHDCVARIYEHVPLAEISSTTISAHGHVSLASIQAMQEYLTRYSNPAKQIVMGGTLGYVLCGNWAEEIRLAIDKSLLFPDALFLAWTTTFRGNRISREVLNSARDAFAESVTKFDLAFPKRN